MRSFRRCLLTALSFLTLNAASAEAEDYLSFNAGYYDALRTKYPSGMVGAEYRFDDVSYGVHPLVGGFVNFDGATYGYVGFNWMVPLLKDQLYIVPSFAAGVYGQGDSRDLGGAIEFRSGIEVDYQFPNRHQIGVSLNHLSNAGLYDHNPGEENILVHYSLPVSSVMDALRAHR